MHLVLHRRRDRRTSRRFEWNRLAETEALESRQLLSTSTVPLSSLTATPAVSAAAGSTPLISGLTPSQIKSAYNFSSSSTAGAGETIAIVDAYNDPNIAADLSAFSTQFGLPQASLSVVNQNGGAALPAANASWAQEIALDVEWAHAAAPGAKIELVEASSANLNDLATAIQTASKTANVVSMSWGSSEFFGETQVDSLFNVPGVTFVASAGDTPGTSWPAVSPNVIGVGGTTLSLSSSGGYGSESVWGSTGGGISAFEPAPSYQASYAGLLGVGARVSPDVGYNANPSSGFAVLDSYQNSYSSTGWFQVGGTSAGAPQWAGIIAAADSARGASLSSTQALSALYQAAGSSKTDFHTVTNGASYFLNTVTGTTFSLGTGLGTPNVANIVAALGGTSATTTIGTGSGSTGATGSTGGGSTGGTQTGGSTGGGKHTHRPLDQSVATVVTVLPVATQTPAGGAFGAVAVGGAGATATSTATASPSVVGNSPVVAANTARPNQPIATPFARMVATSPSDQERVEEQAVDEAGAVKADPAPQPAALPQPAAAPENPAPAAKPEAAPAPAARPGNDSAIDAVIELDAWDDVLVELVLPGSDPLDAQTLAPASTVGASSSVSIPQSAWAAGGAVVAWGLWEARSRLNERRARRPFLKCEPTR